MATEGSENYFTKNPSVVPLQQQTEKARVTPSLLLRSISSLWKCANSQPKKYEPGPSNGLNVSTFYLSPTIPFSSEEWVAGGWRSVAPPTLGQILGDFFSSSYGPMVSQSSGGSSHRGFLTRPFVTLSSPGGFYSMDYRRPL